ncbi:MAG: hypothetical protein AAF433_06650 [Bacteroidota bacterium]
MKRLNSYLPIVFVILISISCTSIESNRKFEKEVKSFLISCPFIDSVHLSFTNSQDFLVEARVVMSDTSLVLQEYLGSAVNSVVASRIFQIARESSLGLKSGKVNFIFDQLGPFPYTMDDLFHPAAFYPRIGNSADDMVLEVLTVFGYDGYLVIGAFMDFAEDITGHEYGTDFFQLIHDATQEVAQASDGNCAMFRYVFLIHLMMDSYWDDKWTNEQQIVLQSWLRIIHQRYPELDVEITEIEDQFNAIFGRGTVSSCEASNPSNR